MADDDKLIDKKVDEKEGLIEAVDKATTDIPDLKTHKGIAYYMRHKYLKQHEKHWREEWKACEKLAAQTRAEHAKNNNKAGISKSKVWKDFMLFPSLLYMHLEAKYQPHYGPQWLDNKKVRREIWDQYPQFRKTEVY